MTGVASRDKVRDVLAGADRLGIGWPLDEGISNEDLRQLLFPGQGSRREKAYVEPDYAYIHGELAKPGVKMSLLWEEYCRECLSRGQTPYMSTQFGDKYRKWAKVTKATMRIAHKPGEAMQVDWAGNTIPIYDSVTGRESAAYLYVAVLPCSRFAYVEACPDMKSENWLLCHVHAFNYFGGVPRLLVPDNLKTGITTNTRYDTIVNRSYQELAVHYDTAIVPARVRHPKDKSIAEGTVKFASTWIIAALRDQRFFTIEEAQEAVREKLDELNDRPFQRGGGNRRTAYLDEEKGFMQPLPGTEYEPAIWTTATVSTDYLVSDGKNRYSVPFDLIGEKVDIRLTGRSVEVFFHGNRVAVHRRLTAAQRDPVVKQDHMTPEHRKYLSYNADDFAMWAKEIGPKTDEVTRYFLSSGKAPEQGYKACASLTKLAARYGNARLENACASILEYTQIPSIRNLSAALRNAHDAAMSRKKAEDTTPPNRYGITRGAGYYAGKGGDGDD